MLEIEFPWKDYFLKILLRAPGPSDSASVFVNCKSQMDEWLTSRCLTNIRKCD